MDTIAITPGEGSPHLADGAEPAVGAPDEVKVRILRVGVCGTDREEAQGGRARAPRGRHDLVIGHEMIGQVVEVGGTVTRVKPGDLAVFTVRRGCGRCLPCRMNRPDMCRTGRYRERGIWGLDGYLARYAVDRERYVVRIPPEIGLRGVLCEPLSIVEKAVGEAVRIQEARLPDAGATPMWLAGRRCLVVGLGPIGLLAAMVLVLRGADVYGLDIVDSDTARPRWLKALGATYIDGRHVPADQVDDVIGPMDVIVEASGASRVAFNVLDALAINGAYVLTGLPGGDRLLQVEGAEIVRRLVLKNQVIFGSVNAARDHFERAVHDLLHAHHRWPGHLDRLITHRFEHTEFERVLCEAPDPDAIKVVLDWDLPNHAPSQAMPPAYSD